MYSTLSPDSDATFCYSHILLHFTSVIFCKILQQSYFATFFLKHILLHFATVIFWQICHNHLLLHFAKIIFCYRILMRRKASFHHITNISQILTFYFSEMWTAICFCTWHDFWCEDKVYWVRHVPVLQKEFCNFYNLVTFWWRSFCHEASSCNQSLGSLHISLTHICVYFVYIKGGLI